MSKIYDELKRAQQSKRESIPLDLLASVMEDPSSSTLLSPPPAQSQSTVADQPPSQDLASPQDTVDASVVDAIQPTTQADLLAESHPDITAAHALLDVVLPEATVENAVEDSAQIHTEPESQFTEPTPSNMTSLRRSSSIVEDAGADVIKPKTTALRPPQYTLWLGLSIGVILLCAVWLLRLRPNHSQASVVSAESSNNQALSLKSERTGSDWRISWNRNAAIVQEALGGHVSITDGAVQKEFELGIGELRNGSLVYSPMSDNVLVQLQLKNNEPKRMVSESIRIVAGSLPKTISRQDKLVGRSADRPLVRTTQPAAFVKDSQSNAAANGRTSVEPMPLTGERSEVARPNPPAGGGGDDNLAASVKTNAVIEPPVHAPPEPSTVANTVPASPSEPTHARVTAPQPIATGLEQAQLIKSGSPTYPFLARQSNIRGSVVVHFRITSTGEVQSAFAVSGSAVLVNAALQAVKTWRYKPARLNGIPVDSEGSVTFDFKPN